MCRGNTARCASNGICCSQGKLKNFWILNYIFLNKIYIHNTAFLIEIKICIKRSQQNWSIIYNINNS